MDYFGKSYLFCGVGGSGMSALAMAMIAKGARIFGSDRNYDRGLFPEHYNKLINAGVTMVAQNGVGVECVETLVVSSAIEESIPDVKAAITRQIPIVKRAALLAELANAVPSVTVGGTNGKSTVTGMIGWMLSCCGFDPTILNGGGMLNFNRDNAVIGHGEVMVLEADESDGSITYFHPDIAVLTNISNDHKDITELKAIFRQYLMQSKRQVLNRDCPVVAALAHDFPQALTYSTQDVPAGLKLIVPGIHNVSNALAALKVADIYGINTDEAIDALNRFRGITSRLEVVAKTAQGITVIDDFGHNPDKIGASLRTLKENRQRLILMYQPHGFGPTKRQKDDLIKTFAQWLEPSDVFYMPEIFYAGGTADQSISSRDIISPLQEQGIDARFLETKADVENAIVTQVKQGDMVCIMGARDDGLREMARRLARVL